MSKILLTITHTGGITPHVAEIKDRLIRDHPECRFVVHMPRMIPYENAMNHAAAMMRSDATITHWLHMDHDNPLLRDPIPLIGKADFIGFPTPMWRPRAGAATALNVGMRGECDPDVDGMTGLQEVGAIGSGAFLMSRKVVEKINMPFVRLVDEFGRVQIGADVGMCRKIHEAGMKVYAHFDYPCDHIKDHIPLLNLYIRERWSVVRPPVVVVGTGRCGTSTVARFLASCGVDMGDVDEQHCECRTIKAINQARIDTRGIGEWANALYFQGWIRGRSGEPWGFKDPRTAEFIDEYVRLFPGATYVWCTRKRENVIESLMRNYGFGRELAESCHDRRLVNVEAAMTHQKHVALPFESIVDGTFEGALCRVLDLEVQAA